MRYMCLVQSSRTHVCVAVIWPSKGEELSHVKILLRDSFLGTRLHSTIYTDENTTQKEGYKHEQN